MNQQIIALAETLETRHTQRSPVNKMTASETKFVRKNRAHHP
jgi:hypothetical protein